MEDLIIKSHFEIVPSYDGRCVFMGVGFNVNDIKMISKAEQARSVLDYHFFVYIGFSEEFKLEFNFRKLKLAEAAYYELARAWTKTGEFSDEYAQRLGA